MGSFLVKILSGLLILGLHKNMIQAKFSLEKAQVEFLEQFKACGFKDKSEVVRVAIEHLYQKLEQQSLLASAELYAQLYEEEEEIKKLVEDGLAEWPE
jgi:Arc/MetJ-type ribon-helix-helix transcriptional regulator